MTSAGSLVAAVAGTGVGTVLMAEVAAVEPWWIAAIVVPLAGFSAWLVRWILQKQDLREAAIAEREKARESREESRAVHVGLQTQAMQECVSELRKLNQAQQEMPDRVASRLRDHDLVAKRSAG